MRSIVVLSQVTKRTELSFYRIALLVSLLIYILPGCDSKEPTKMQSRTEAKKSVNENVVSDNGIRLVDRTLDSEIDFVHQYDGKNGRYIVEAVGSGMAAFDFDVDGNIDLYFLNGSDFSTAKGVPSDSSTSPNSLYRNLGSMHFINGSSLSHCNAEEFGMGVCVGDFNSDGFPDLFVNNFGPNRLYQNQGDGTFIEMAESAGIACPDQMGAGATFFDADQDGFLDLYVGHYVRDPISKNVKRTTDGYPSYPGPLDFTAETDRFFLNSGDGTFRDATQERGLGDIATTSMSVVAADFDDDGDDDVLVVNDVERNLFYINDGKGFFEESAIPRGIAFAGDGRRNGNMGLDVADFDGNGTLDVFTSTFSNEYPVLYSNSGNAVFSDVTLAKRAGTGLFPHANWGVAFMDLDNDGDKDLFVCNGHTDPMVSSWAFTTAWKVQNTVFLNDNGKFFDISKRALEQEKPPESGRGMIAEDLDNNGSIDIAILNSNAPPTILKNETIGIGNWIRIKLIGRRSPRDAIGTCLRLVNGSKPQISQVITGRSYQSSFGQTIHFGVGESTGPIELQIHWPNTAGDQKISIESVNQTIFVIEPL